MPLFQVDEHRSTLRVDGRECAGRPRRRASLRTASAGIDGRGPRFLAALAQGAGGRRRPRSHRAAAQAARPRFRPGPAASTAVSLRGGLLSLQVGHVVHRAGDASTSAAGRPPRSCWPRPTTAGRGRAAGRLVRPDRGPGPAGRAAGAAVRPVGQARGRAVTENFLRARDERSLLRLLQLRRLVRRAGPQLGQQRVRLRPRLLHAVRPHRQPRLLPRGAGRRPAPGRRRLRARLSRPVLRGRQPRAFHRPHRHVDASSRRTARGAGATATTPRPTTATPGRRAWSRPGSSPATPP